MHFKAENLRIPKHPQLLILAKNLWVLQLQFGEWVLFEKMSILSHFKRQFWSFKPISDVTLFSPKITKFEICLLKCDKLDILSKSPHSPNF